MSTNAHKRSQFSAVAPCTYVAEQERGKSTHEGLRLCELTTSIDLEKLSTTVKSEELVTVSCALRSREQSELEAWREASRQTYSIRHDVRTNAR